MPAEAALAREVGRLHMLDLAVSSTTDPLFLSPHLILLGINSRFLSKKNICTIVLNMYKRIVYVKEL